MSFLKTSALVLAAGGVLAAGYLGYLNYETRSKIRAFEQQVIASASESKPGKTNGQTPLLTGLPEPVRAYFHYVLPNGIPEGFKWVEVEQEGDFRRPHTEDFNPTTARQVLATTLPNIAFSADTPVFGAAWATVNDTYINGHMDMQAKLLTAIPIMRETGNDTLNRISLRRWLLESSLNPVALLPGGIVAWEPIDDYHARAWARAEGYETSLVATFDDSGALVSFHAEEDGDLTTPYHGSGEHVTRGDYSLIDGVRVPMTFEISRMAQGKRYPFWRGRITSIAFGK